MTSMDAPEGDGPQRVHRRLREIRFSFQHEGCWLQETSERFPGLLLVVNDLYKQAGRIHLNVTLHGADAATREQAVEGWIADGRIEEVTFLSSEAGSQRYHVAYSWEGSIYTDLIDHTPVTLGPLQIVDGTEHYQMIGRLDDLREMVDHLRTKGRLVVTTLTEPSDPGGTLEPSAWEQLTDRQLQALMVAKEAGYYSWPREVSASEAAEELGLSSSAFIEHLRRGEAKLIGAMIDRLSDQAPSRMAKLRPGAPQEPRTPPSSD